MKVSLLSLLLWCQCIKSSRAFRAQTELFGSLSGGKRCNYCYNALPRGDTSTASRALTDTNCLLLWWHKICFSQTQLQNTKTPLMTKPPKISYISTTKRCLVHNCKEKTNLLCLQYCGFEYNWLMLYEALSLNVCHYNYSVTSKTEKESQF